MKNNYDAIEKFKNSKKVTELTEKVKKIKNGIEYKNNLFTLYKILGGFQKQKSIFFESESILVDALLNRYDQIERNDKKILNKFLKEIETQNPFENYDRYREEYRIDRSNEDLENQRSFYFCERPGYLERDIEANLFQSKLYCDTIGIPFCYEFPLNKRIENQTHKMPVDLISYKKEDNTLYIIELKRCNANFSSTEDEQESKEFLIRAMWEVTTYYSYFMHIWNDSIQGELLRKELNKLAYNCGIIKENETLPTNLKIKKAILAPVNFYNTNSEYIKCLVDQFTCFTIERKDDIDLTKEKISESNKKLFSIECLKNN